MTTNMLYTILSIQPKESGGESGETREESVMRQSKDMLAKVPSNYDPFEVKERLSGQCFRQNVRDELF